MKNQKILKIFIGFIFTVTTMFAITQAVSANSDFTINSDGVLTGYTGPGGAITIPSNVTSIERFAFYGNKNITSVIIPNSVTSIGDEAFSACTNLLSVIIGNGVTSIGDYAFIECTNLTNVTIGNGVTSIGEGAFSNCTSLSNVNIGNRVTSIGNSAFYGCTSLTSVTIPNSVTSIGNGAFGRCTSLTNVIIPDSVTSIGNDAFGRCTSLTSVIIPDGVKSIGYSAFNECANLTSVIIPNSVTSIGSTAFRDCASLTSITLSESITSIEWRTFSGCISLTSITIPNSVTIIEADAFNGCINLTDITIPDSVTSIGFNAFFRCTNLTSVPILHGTTSIRNNEFSNFVNLTSITIPDSVTSIGTGAFSGCTSLTSVTIPDSVTSIGNHAFNGCTSLANVNIGNSVTSIGEGTFSNCINLTGVTIPNSVTSIGEGAFNNCISLTSIKIPNSVTIIGDYAFSNCMNLTNIVIPNSVMYIVENAFSLEYWEGTVSKVWSPGVGIEINITETTTWNIMALVFMNVDIPGVFNHSLNNEDVVYLTGLMDKVKRSLGSMSGGLMSVDKMDVYTVYEPIRRENLAPNGLILQETISHALDENLRKAEYDQIIIIAPVHGVAIGWDGVGGGSYYSSEDDLKHKGAGIVHVLQASGMYDFNSAFPEAVYIHEIIHCLENRSLSRGHTPVSLHNLYDYGYSYDPFYGGLRWYSDFMQNKLPDGMGIAERTYITHRYSYRIIPDSEFPPLPVPAPVQEPETAPEPTPTPAPEQTPAAQTARPTSAAVLINGENAAFDAYNIEGNNYFKLRDLAFVLSGTEKQFNVGWDRENNAIALTSGESYDIVGGEMEPSTTEGNRTAAPTTSEIYLDGELAEFTAYLIGGNNYFKLRDVMETFDVYVGWDGASNTITLDTSMGYES